MRRYRTLLVAAALATWCLTAHADVKLAQPFSDYMVLQRDLPVAIWGQADPGEKVAVEFAGQSKSTVSAADGRWMIKLDPLKASVEDRVLSVTGNNTLTLQHVLVGEVWLCSGQSNMEVSLERIKTSRGGSAEFEQAGRERIEKELAASTPNLRLYRNPLRKGASSSSGWSQCDPGTLKNQQGLQGFSAVGYFFGKELSRELQVPIGLVEASVGGTTVETWTPPTGKNFVALVNPIAPFSLRGVIWYQGESNLIAGDDAESYRDKMKALINGWRELWQRSDLPFYYVQLPPMAYSKRRDKVRHTAEALPQIREGQAMVLRLPHTGMVITTDLADANDLHPMNKWDVGARLARLALAQTYGKKEIVFSGPVYQSMKREGGKLVLEFDHVDGGLVSKNAKPLAGFQVAGIDRQFVPAQAVIAGNTVVVSSETVAEPVAVRFGWHEDARPNLFNQAGLPAAPFRTDNWPVPVIVPNNSTNSEAAPVTDVPKS
ncbi:MAG: sialate O-acetylesterase [Verrucomicrobiota bacterium]